MTVIIHRVGRIATRRSFQRQHQVFSPASKRQKSRAVEKGAKDVNAQSSVEEAKTIPRPDIVPSVPLWQRLGLLSKAFKAYGKAQRENPYTTQVCSSLVIYFCGDLSAQNIGGEKYDLLRTGRNMVIGGICSIPAYKWFMYLGQSLNYSSKTLSLSAKVVVNQIVFTPIFNTYFFGMQSLLSGDGFAQAWERIKQTVPVSFVNSWKLWPAVTAFSFTYIDPQYRALFAGFIAIGWQSYLSWLNQRAATEQLARKGMNIIPSDNQTFLKKMPSSE
ncbi:hypothetical protein MMC24_004830 [Lignoscripta atroalba]|nr:hypothetical protein [Lignoscripta atroalba]